MPKAHTLSRKTMLTIRNLSWPKSKAKILTSLLTATTMNSKYCKPFAIPFAKDEMSRIDGTRGGGGRVTPIWNRRGYSFEILNLTPKGYHLGVAQAFCDP